MYSTNTLVVHKKHPEFGIGCIAKCFSKNANVNFGLYDVKKVSYSMLDPIIIPNLETRSFDEYRNRILNENSDLNICIVGNELRSFVGIGWTTDRVITIEDLLKYPRII